MEKSNEKRCKSCNSTQVFEREGGGEMVCYECGAVAEWSSLINTTEFNADGQAMGQYVSATSSRAYGSGGRNVQRNSREVTLKNGTTEINRIAPLVSLKPRSHITDSAVRLFRMASEKNMIQGRRTTHVCAVCLYIVCRWEKSPQLLIDFSDVLKVNVFILGSLFIKMKDRLNIQPVPLIDPSLYIHRFAQGLEFGDETTKVATTALRLVKRMRRDWIVSGRRPTGICAAALVIAARCHSFRRSQREILKVVKITAGTLSDRLNDFAKTQAATLKLDEFERLASRTNNFEQGNDGKPVILDSMQIADPPSYTRNRMIEQKLLLKNAKAEKKDLETSNENTTIVAISEKGDTTSREAAASKEPNKEDDEFKKLYTDLMKEFSGSASSSSSSLPSSKQDSEQASSHSNSCSSAAATKLSASNDKVSKNEGVVDISSVSKTASSEEDDDDSDEDAINESVMSMLRDEEEVEQKTSEWEELNGDWEQKQREKKEEQARTGKTTSKRKRKRNDEELTTSTAQNVGVAPVEEKPISKKVNYDALDSFFAEGDSDDDDDDDE